MTKLLDISEAAEYLGLTLQGIKHHIYVAGTLEPTRYFGRSPAFSVESLDEFNEKERRGPGRPRGKEDDNGLRKMPGTTDEKIR